MSMHPQNIPDIPKETAQVARAAFPKGNIYIQIRDTLGSVYEDEANARVVFPVGYVFS